MKFALTVLFAAFAFASSVASARGPYNLPDRVDCTIDNPDKPGYWNRQITFSFDHVEDAGSVQRNGPIDVVISPDQGADQKISLKNKALDLDFSARTVSGTKVLDLKKLVFSPRKGLVTTFSFDEQSGRTVITSAGDAGAGPVFFKDGDLADCLYLDGTIAKPSLSGSN